MNPSHHLSTILILGDDNRFRAHSHMVCDCAEIAEQAGEIVLTKISQANPTKQFIHRTMPFHHVPNNDSLKTEN